MKTEAETIASQKAESKQEGAWYLEDAQALLPHGPFATRAAAQDVATEIGCGRPVFVPISEDGSVNREPDYSTTEPQEMTRQSVLTPDEERQQEEHLASEDVPDEDGTRAFYRRAEYDPEAADEMARDDAAGRS